MTLSYNQLFTTVWHSQNKKYNICFDVLTKKSKILSTTLPTKYKTLILTESVLEGSIKEIGKSTVINKMDFHQMRNLGQAGIVM